MVALSKHIFLTSTRWHPHQSINLGKPKKKKIKAIKRTDIEMAVSHNQLDMIHTYDIEEVVRRCVYGI